MADCRAERVEIASVEGVSSRADNRIYRVMAIFRYAAYGRYDWNVGRRINGNMANLRRYRVGDFRL